MRIALIVDHPRRELPGLVLLAGRLCQGGRLRDTAPAADWNASAKAVDAPEVQRTAWIVCRP